MVEKNSKYSGASSVNAELSGHVAVVTGAARGIGAEIARTLAERGAKVISIDLATSDATIDSIEQFGGEALAIQADLTNEGAVADAFENALACWGQLDILVNNAGIFTGVERKPFWEITADNWDHMMQVNVRSVFLCSRAASKPMREARHGRIVNISSNVSVFGMPNFLQYVASKSAVVGMTRGMARELGPFGIAVNAVAPGLVTTEVTRETVPEDYRRQVAEGQCLVEPLVPQDIAAAVAYLAGPNARLVTGQTLLVNGGATMGPA